MTKYRIQFNGKSGTTPVWFNQINPGEDSAKFLSKRKEMNHAEQTCCLTGQPIGEEEGIYLVWNNSVLFPNAIASKKSVDDMGYVEATALLRKSWIDAQRFKSWFV